MYDLLFAGALGAVVIAFTIYFSVTYVVHAFHREVVKAHHALKVDSADMGKSLLEMMKQTSFETRKDLDAQIQNIVHTVTKRLDTYADTAKVVGTSIIENSESISEDVNSAVDVLRSLKHPAADALTRATVAMENTSLASDKLANIAQSVKPVVDSFGQATDSIGAIANAIRRWVHGPVQWVQCVALTISFAATCLVAPSVSLLPVGYLYLSGMATTLPSLAGGFSSLVLMPLITLLKQKLYNPKPEAEAKEEEKHSVIGQVFRGLVHLVAPTGGFNAMKVENQAISELRNFLGLVRDIPTAITYLTKFCSLGFGAAYYRLTGEPWSTDETEEIVQRAIAWVEEGRALFKSHDEDNYLRDTITARRIVQHYTRGQEIAQELMDHKYTDGNFFVFFEMYKRYAALAADANKIISSATSRVAPFCFHLFGPPFSGKSNAMLFFGADLLRLSNLNFDGNSVFDRKIDNEYWDGYFGQPFVTYDDFLQSKTKETREQLALELIYAINDVPFQLHMANVNLKSNTYFNSLIVGMTSQSNEIADFQHFMEDLTAFQSRRDIVLEIVPRKRDITTTGRDVFQLEAWSRDIYKFNLIHPISGKILVPNIDYSGALRIMWDSFNKKLCGGKGSLTRQLMREDPRVPFSIVKSMKVELQMEGGADVEAEYVDMQSSTPPKKEWKKKLSKDTMEGRDVLNSVGKFVCTEYELSQIYPFRIPDNGDFVLIFRGELDFAIASNVNIRLYPVIYNVGMNSKLYQIADKVQDIPFAVDLEQKMIMCRHLFSNIPDSGRVELPWGSFNYNTKEWRLKLGAYPKHISAHQLTALVSDFSDHWQAVRVSNTMESLKNWPAIENFPPSQWTPRPIQPDVQVVSDMQKRDVKWAASQFTQGRNVVTFVIYDIKGHILVAEDGVPFTEAVADYHDIPSKMADWKRMHFSEILRISDGVYVIVGHLEHDDWNYDCLSEKTIKSVLKGMKDDHAIKHCWDDIESRLTNYKGREIQAIENWASVTKVSLFKLRAAANANAAATFAKHQIAWKKVAIGAAAAVGVGAGVFATAWATRNLWMGALEEHGIVKTKKESEGKDFYDPEMKRVKQPRQQFVHKRAGFVRKPQAQTSDPNAEDIVQHRLCSNGYSIRIEDEETHLGADAYLLFVRGQNAMMIKHTLMWATEEHCIDRMIMTCTNPTRSFTVRIKDLAICPAENTDLVAVTFPKQVVSHKDITHLFNTASEIAQHYENWVSLVSVGPKLETRHSSRTLVRGELTYTHKGEDVLIANCIVASLQTHKGLCGSVYVVFNPSIAKKILGMHVAGAGHSGFGIPIVQEDIEEAFGFVEGKPVAEGGENDWEKVMTPRMNSSFDEIPSVYPSKRAIEMYDATVTACVSNMLVDGTNELAEQLKGVGKKVLGVVGPQWNDHIPNKSPYAKSVIHEMVRPARHGPAEVRRKRGERSPLQLGVDKLAGAGLKPKDGIENVYCKVFGLMLRDMQDEGVNFRVLTLDEALNGVYGWRYINPIDMSKSVGVPYTLLREELGHLHGKYKLAEMVNGRRRLTAFGMECYNDFEQFLLYGKVTRLCHSMFAGKLKANETRPYELLCDHARCKQLFEEEGVTHLPQECYRVKPARLYFAGSFIHSLFIRRYFGAYIEMRMRSHNTSAQKPGVNPHNLEWLLLAQQMDPKDEFVIFSGDYKFFDTDTSDRVQYPSFKMADLCYDKFSPQNVLPEDRRARFVLTLTIVRHVVQINSVVYIDDHGNPSGNSITTTHNSDNNEGMLRVVITAIVVDRDPERYGYSTMEEWFYSDDCDDALEEIGMRTDLAIYGDDNIIKAAKAWGITLPEIIEMMARLVGMRYTDFRKKDFGIDYHEFDEIEFLKRKFRRARGFVYAPLNEEVLYDIINWVKPEKQDVVACTLENCAAAIREAYHYGPEFFHKFTGEINNALIQVGAPPVCLTYAKLDREYISQRYFGIEGPEAQPPLYQYPEAIETFVDPTDIVDIVAEGGSICRPMLSVDEEGHEEEILVPDENPIDHFETVEDIAAAMGMSVDDYWDWRDRQDFEEWKEEHDEFYDDDFRDPLAEELENYETPDEEDEEPEPLSDIDEYYDRDYMFCPTPSDNEAQEEEVIVVEKPIVAEMTTDADVCVEDNEQVQLTAIADQVPTTSYDDMFCTSPIYGPFDPYPDQRVDTLLTRMYTSTITVTGAMARDTIVADYDFPRDLIAAQPKIKDTLSKFQGFASGVVMEFRPNGNQFFQGAMIITFLPHYAPFYQFTNVFTASMNPHIILSFNSNDTVRICIPYVGPAEFWNTSHWDDDEAEGFFGYVRAFVLAPLTQVNAAVVPSINISVQMYFSSPRVAGFSSVTIPEPWITMHRKNMFKPKHKRVPNKFKRLEAEAKEDSDVEEFLHGKIEAEGLEDAVTNVIGAVQSKDPGKIVSSISEAVQNTPLNKEAEKTTKSGTISSVARTVSTMSGYFASIPAVGKYAAVVAPAAKAVELVARFFGKDRPTSVAQIAPMAPMLTDNMSMGVGLDNAQKIAIDPKNGVANNPAYFCDKRDYTLFKNYINLPGMVYMGTVTSAMAEGHQIFALPIAPTMSWIEVDEGVQKIYRTPLCFVADFFTYARGSMKFAVKFFCSPAVSFRVRFSWVPSVHHLPDPGEDGAGDYISKIVDVRGETTTTFTVPYLQMEDYMRIVPYTLLLEHAVVEDDGHYNNNGMLLMTLVNVVALANQEVPVTVDFALFVAGGEDMQFYLPKSPYYGAYFDPGVMVAKKTVRTWKVRELGHRKVRVVNKPQSESCEVHSMRLLFQDTFEPLTKANLFVRTGVVHGEEIQDFKTLCHRYTIFHNDVYICTDQVLNLDDYNENLIGFDDVLQNFRLQVDQAFLFNRGSIRYKVIPLSMQGLTNNAQTNQFTFGATLWPVTTYPDVNQPYPWQPEPASQDIFGGHRGLVVQDAMMRKAIEFEVPYYHNRLMRTILPLKGDFEGLQAPWIAFINNFGFELVPQPSNFTAMGGSANINVLFYSAVGDDYSWGMPLAPPGMLIDSLSLKKTKAQAGGNQPGFQRKRK